MQANKAQNLILYEKEIYQKPKRTWFQSEKQKQEIQGSYYRILYIN